MPRIMRWLPAAGASCLLFGAAVLGTFAPLRDADGIQYLFAWPGESTVLRLLLTVAVVLPALCAAIMRAATRRGPADRDRAKSGRWMAPLSVLGVVAIGESEPRVSASVPVDAP